MTNKSIVDTIRKWMAAIPPNIAVLKEDHEPDFIRITPIKSGSCNVEFELSLDGDEDTLYGLYFGQGFCFDEGYTKDIDADCVVNILEAISQGGFREKVWKVNNKILRTQGELRLKDGTVLRDRGSYGFLSIFMTGTVQDIEYVSWF